MQKNTPPNSTFESSKDAADNSVCLTIEGDQRPDRNGTLRMTNLPEAVLDLIVEADWLIDNLSMNMFSHHLEWFTESDWRDGCTSAYYLSDDDSVLTADELENMICDGVVPREFHGGYGVINQHYAHSIQQVMAVVQRTLK